MAAEPQGNERVRTAELIAALCLATDLGMAFPFEHGLHTTLIAMRLAGKLGIDRPSACETYYACQLAHAGCTTEAHAAAEICARGGVRRCSGNSLSAICSLLDPAATRSSTSRSTVAEVGQIASHDRGSLVVAQERPQLSDKRLPGRLCC